MKKQTVKRAIFASVMSLLLCVSMLVGTTFAWFTDAVTSGNNIIKSGNLDVEMYWADGTKAVPTVDNGWTDASQGAIFDYDKWEPGYTQVRHIKLAIKGTLALKYQVSIVANGEVSDLANVIDVYYVDPAVQVANRTDLTDANKLGTLTQVLAKLGETGSGELAANTFDTITLAFKMQESADNKYMNKSIGTDFSVVLNATQLTYESDSFGNQYDNGAQNPAMDIITVPENNTADIVLSTETVNIAVPAAAAQAGDVYKLMVSDEKVATNEVTGETTVSLDVDLYKNYAKVSVSETIYEVKLTIAKGVTISEVTHNGIALTEATTGADQTYTYDFATGVLTVYTKSFSPFTIAYDMNAIIVTDAETAQAALDNAASGTVIKLTPGVNYGTLELRPNIVLDGKNPVAGNANTEKVDYYTAKYPNEFVRNVENIIIIGAPGAKVDAIKFGTNTLKLVIPETGKETGTMYRFVEVKNLILDSIEFTDASTIAAATGKVSPIYLDLQNTRVDGLTVVNCKLEGNVSNMNFVYANATTGGGCDFTASLKNVNIIGNTVSGIARLCELREAENVTIKDNNVANLTRELALLGNNGTNAYSGNLVVTGNTADNIATDYAAQNLEGLFFRVGVGGDADVTVKENVITNSGCVETSFVNVTSHTGTLTVENNTLG